MIAEELINKMIAPLKSSDKPQKALQWIDEFRVNQLPVVDNFAYMGMVNEDLIFQNNQVAKTLGELDLLCTDVFVYHNQHFFDILRLSNLFNIQAIAVLDSNDAFLGVVTVQDVMNTFASSVSMQEQGGILVFLLDKRDYSLTEISRLVESNNAKILSTYITDDKQDATKLRVTIKLNTPDMNRIVATFERYSYRIVAQFQSGQYQEVEKERIDILFKYLNI